MNTSIQPKKRAGEDVNAKKPHYHVSNQKELDEYAYSAVIERLSKLTPYHTTPIIRTVKVEFSYKNSIASLFSFNHDDNKGTDDIDAEGLVSKNLIQLPLLDNQRLLDQLKLVNEQFDSKCYDMEKAYIVSVVVSEYSNSFPITFYWHLRDFTSKFIQTKNYLNRKTSNAFIFYENENPLKHKEPHTIFKGEGPNSLESILIIGGTSDVDDILNGSEAFLMKEVEDKGKDTVESYAEWRIFRGDHTLVKTLISEIQNRAIEKNKIESNSPNCHDNNDNDNNIYKTIHDNLRLIKFNDGVNTTKKEEKTPDNADEYCFGGFFDDRLIDGIICRKSAVDAMVNQYKTYIYPGLVTTNISSSSVVVGYDINYVNVDSQKDLLSRFQKAQIDGDCETYNHLKQHFVETFLNAICHLNIQIEMTLVLYPKSNNIQEKGYHFCANFPMTNIDSLYPKTL